MGELEKQLKTIKDLLLKWPKDSWWAIRLWEISCEITLEKNLFKKQELSSFLNKKKNFSRRK